MGHLPNAHFIEADVLDYLARAPEQRWEAIYSMWGLWFVDPQQWMPLVRERLALCGTLACSWAPAVPGCYGIAGHVWERLQGASDVGLPVGLRT
ncbi:hypothetical protein ACQEVF_57210 [Nonomuraea polychroma]|uniref:hypothetical protein n=1 Tax=Nonomuraea polychroma TaxID=46176 RepID=UPI003D93EDBA